MKKVSTRKWKHPEGYKYLACWTNAVLLRFLIRRFTETLPRSEHRGKTQVDDAARSVVANIEEGWKRDGTKDYLKFLSFSQGSLEEVKGDIKRFYQDGYLKSVPGSSLAGVGIDLKEIKRRLEETKGNVPLNLLYHPLSSLTGDDLTFEMMMELINKTDWLLRRTVSALEQSLTKEDAFSPLERWRWQKLEAELQKEKEFDTELQRILKDSRGD